MNSPRTTRLAKILDSSQRLAVHVDPKTKKTYKYLERDQALLKYQGQENTFGTFTSIFKLGINPSSTYNTPTGIYSYPIDYIIEKYDPERGLFHVPYPSLDKQQFIHVFSVPDLSRCLIFKPGDSRVLKTYRDGKPASEINNRLEGAREVLRFMEKYYKEHLGEVDLENMEGVYRWFNMGGGPWNLLGMAYPKTLDIETSNMVEDFFGIDSDISYNLEGIRDFLKSRQGLRFRSIVESGVAPNTTELWKKIVDYYNSLIIDNISFPYEDRFKRIFLKERGYHADYDEFKNEEVLAFGQRVVCDQAFVWNATRHLSDHNPRRWTAYMRQMGLIGAVDYGTMTIHENEETQALFFDPPSLKLEETIDNRIPQYASGDKARFNMSGWSRKPDEREIFDKLNTASAHTEIEIDALIRVLKSEGDPFGYMGSAWKRLSEAFGYAETAFKYLGWVTSHRQLLEGKTLQDEIEWAVARARICHKKLTSLTDKISNSEAQKLVNKLDAILAKTIRNFGNRG